MFLFLRLLFASLLSLSLLGVSPVCAETVKIYGLVFHVDQVIEIDERSVKVVAFGEEKIISPAQSNSYIAKLYISEDIFFDRFKTEEIERFIAQAVAEQDVSVSVAALREYLLASELSVARKKIFLVSLGWKKSVPKIYKELLKEKSFLDASAVSHHLIAIVGASDLSWVRQNVPLEVFSNRKKFLSHISWMVVEQGEDGITNGLSPRLVTFSEKLFGLKDKSVQQVSVIVDKLKGLLTLQATNGRTALYPFLGKNIERQEAQVLRPLVIKKIHEFSEFAVQEKNGASALILLTELDPTERSERTQELVIQALNSIRSEDSEVRSNRGVRNFLEDESVNNPAVRTAYSNYLRREFDALVLSGQLRTAASVREQLKKINQQDQAGYDRMIFEEALEWIREGRVDAGEELLNLRSKAPGYFEKLELFFAGRYGSPLSWLLWSLIPILFTTLVIIRVIERIQPEEVEEDKYPRDEEDEVDWGDQQEYHEGLGVQFTGLRGRVSPELREYRELLGKLDLPQDAGLSEIKTVYRKMIKEVHPDAHGGVNAETSDEFITLSRAYERIMELRKSMGLRE